jgi:hypothetical protein
VKPTFPLITVKARLHSAIETICQEKQHALTEKGGKHLFGWSQISKNGTTIIPAGVFGISAGDMLPATRRQLHRSFDDCQRFDRRMCKKASRTGLLLIK